jgi:hypothetical protein
MMFLPNDVIQYTDPARALRVLWVEAQAGIVHLFVLGGARKLPEPVPIHVLTGDVRSGRARLLLQDPYAAAPAPAVLPQKQRDMQERAWRIVVELQSQAPALYYPRERAAMVARIADDHGVSRASVLRWLRRFWERGQNQNALLPDYANSGARGKTRTANSGVKRGRPRKSGSYQGLNVDDATRAVFRAAVARYRAAHPGAGFVRRAAYRQMLDEFYKGAPSSQTPSFGQFNYWLDKDDAPSVTGKQKPATYPRFVAVQHT